MAAQTLQDQVYEMLTSEDDGRVCKDIPESACAEQPQNFIRHVVSLTATKSGDGLADPKLVLSWLLGALGAPAYVIGLLVPLREAGALLPQLFIAGKIRSMPKRKWVWAAGSLVQGVCVLGMGIVALTLSGVSAGWSIVALITVFACARSACSVSYKDVLGKTVSKSTRGTATGTASSLSAIVVLMFGVALSVGVLSKSVTTIAMVLIVAALLWVAAAVVFTTLVEAPGATEDGGNPIQVAVKQAKLLKEDPQLTRFIATRGLLISTALAPPYLLALSMSDRANALGQLGPFVIASAVAAIVSGYVWGRLSDKSSRKVLAIAALSSAGLFAVVVAIAVLAPDWLSSVWVTPPLLFVLMIAYNGVRLGRVTHVVDMADEGTRAAYTALSNSIVGVLLLAGGAFALVAQYAGEPAVFVIFTMMCALAARLALGLDEVQSEA